MASLVDATEDEVVRLNNTSAMLEAEARKVMAEASMLNAEGYKIVAERYKTNAEEDSFEQNMPISPGLTFAIGLVLGIILFGGLLALLKYLGS